MCRKSSFALFVFLCKTNETINSVKIRNFISALKRERKHTFVSNKSTFGPVVKSKKENEYTNAYA